MIKLCPWKKMIMKHNNSTKSYDESGVYTSDCTNEDVSIDFGNCSLNACPFYDDSEIFANGCRRVGTD